MSVYSDRGWVGPPSVERHCCRNVRSLDVVLPQLPNAL